MRAATARTSGVLLRVFIAAGLLPFMACGVALADVIYLKNGRTIEGFVVEEKPGSIVVDIGFGRIGLNNAEIDNIVRSDEGQAGLLRQKWQEQERQRTIREQEEKLREERRPKEATIASEGGGLVVEALLNNKVKVRLILDTGASLTTINRNVIEQLGYSVDSITKKQKFTLADGTRRESKLLVLDSISVQGVEARNVEISVMESREAVPQLQDGLLGMSFLKNFNFKIDSKRNRLILEQAH